MAHHIETVGYPNLPLNGTMIVRLRALSPTSDAAVAGVSCTLWALYGRDFSAGPLLAEELPIWVPEADAAVEA